MPVDVNFGTEHAQCMTGNSFKNFILSWDNFSSGLSIASITLTKWMASSLDNGVSIEYLK